jgi:hypothetical protein
MLQHKAKFGLKENVEYVLRDKDGNVKPIFQPNELCRALLKRNLISPKLQIPGLFGNWSDKMVLENLVVNAGFAGVASRINGSGAEAAFTYIAVGTGTTGAAAGNTTLETETTTSGLGRANATASRVTTTVTNDTAQLLHSFSVTGTVAVTESGVFNDDTTGTLLARQGFTAINVVDGDTLQITWRFAVSTS